MGLLKLNNGPFQRFGSRYNTFFDSGHFLGRNALDDSWLTHTPADVQQNGKDLYVEVALPGFTKEEVKLDLVNNELHISAVKASAEDAKGVYEIEEIPKNVNRYFQLSSSMDQENIKADLSNGVLRITIPYTKDFKSSEKKVEVQ